MTRDLDLAKLLESASEQLHRAITEYVRDGDVEGPLASATQTLMLALAKVRDRICDRCQCAKPDCCCIYCEDCGANHGPDGEGLDIPPSDEIAARIGDVPRCHSCLTKTISESGR